MSFCSWAHLMGFLSRHAAATACGCHCMWLPLHVAVAAVCNETDEALH